VNTGSNGWRDWIGRTESDSDLVAATPAAALAALLDQETDCYGTGAALAPAWHWLYFRPIMRASQTGPDGHPRRGAFLPPIALPRRMWAGGHLDLLRPMRVGAVITRSSTLTDVDCKQGRSGSLIFVKIEHRIHDRDGLLVAEQQDIVYRGAAPQAAAVQAVRAAPPFVLRATEGKPADALWRREICPDPVMLFRYSALTWNAHRIHYDHPYATQVEGYPGLVVQGPLIATLLLDLLRRESPGRELRTFSFRAVRPVFSGRPFQLCGCPVDGGRTARLWALDADGALAMEATAETAQGAA
jgi:3-methylfumaryl-CoA hydratase